MQVDTTRRPATIADKLDASANALDYAVRVAYRATAWGQVKAALAAPLRPSGSSHH